MTTLAPSTDYTGGAVNQGGKKTFVANLRAYVADLLGTDSANKAAVRALLGVSPVAQDFRLSLTSGLPITTADVTGASTLYASPFAGNFISLFDGTYWNARASAEFSIALTGLTSGKLYDVFAYDNAGVPALELLVWTNDTTRATALAYQDGVLSKAGALTRRYLGTIYATSATTTEDSKSKRYVWNGYHRVPRLIQRIEPTAQWTQATTATWRQANASSANQVGFVIGVAGDMVRADLNAMFSPNNGYKNAAALALDSITVPTGLYGPSGSSSSSSVTEMPLVAKYAGTPAAGLHYLAWLEWMQSSGFTTTWYGTNNTATYQTQCGILGEVMA
ncbi:MAG: hypothetical protein V4718_00540 [Pseudomonadota bacterium]